MNERAVFDKYGVSPKQLDSLGLAIETLNSIENNYSSLKSRFEMYAKEMVEIFHSVKEIYALNYSVSLPGDLIASIIQSKMNNPDKEITESNYLIECRDIIVVKVLYLNERELLQINAFIKDAWDLKETPWVELGPAKDGGILDELVAKERYTTQRGACRSVNYPVFCGHTRKRTVALVQVKNAFEDAWNCMNCEMKNLYTGMFARIEEYRKSLDEAGKIADILQNHIKNGPYASSESVSFARGEARTTAIHKEQSIAVGEDDEVVINSPVSGEGAPEQTRGVPVEDLTRTDFIRQKELRKHKESQKAQDSNEIIVNSEKDDPTQTQIIRSISDTVELKGSLQPPKDTEVTSYIPQSDLDRARGDKNRDKEKSDEDKPVIIKASDDIIINLSASPPGRSKKAQTKNDIASTVFLSKKNLEKGEKKDNG
ncbi:MAG: hypothetical protein GF401_04850 [Chitinivibrionales bacterium]|nr:hypothetical protein [Chitinivibrionales bacterium]